MYGIEMLMRCFVTVSALLWCLVVAPVRSETLWAAGVSADSGWFDFNKTHQRGENGDDLLCWAVVASNLVAWWQQQHPELVQQGTPVGRMVWETYQAAFENEGGDPDMGIHWWFSGCYNQPPAGMRCAVLRENAPGGYFRETEVKSAALLHAGRGSAVTAQSLTDALVGGFRRGGCVLAGRYMPQA